jgi:tetratricopeptide (TPR) repeat protein
MEALSAQVVHFLNKEKTPQQTLSESRTTIEQAQPVELQPRSHYAHRFMRARRGFILLFGTRAITSADHSAPSVNTVCPRCSRQTEMLGKTYRTWFTLFFIPVFPVSGAHPISQCRLCGAKFPVSTRELSSRVASSDREQSARAIAMYNSLRNSPANSVTLNDLMTLYASMSEYDQAISAAGQFPQALNNSEQCMTTLGRIYLAKNDHKSAIQWFDAAITRNPQLGEAQYFKAVAHLTDTPPEVDQAIAAARAARAAGHPNAEELFRQAQEKARQAAG